MPVSDFCVRRKRLSNISRIYINTKRICTNSRKICANSTTICKYEWIPFTTTGKMGVKGERFLKSRQRYNIFLTLSRVEAQKHHRKSRNVFFSFFLPFYDNHFLAMKKKRCNFVLELSINDASQGRHRPFGGRKKYHGTTTRKDFTNHRACGRCAVLG